MGNPKAPAKLTGKRFGSLLVVKRSGNNRFGGTRWICRCDCGVEGIFNAINLLQGNSKSCGCGRKARADRELLKDRMRKAQKLCPSNRVPVERACFNRVLRTYRKGARDRNLHWCLDYPAFERLLRSPCFYCGRAPHQKAKCRRGHVLYTGIDRVDSSQGYTPENVLPSCGTCNYMKASKDMRTFLSHIRSIYAHRFAVEELS